ncbi:MAG: insulinase family protein [Acidobacteria bacterium]|nr:insulinase family protein [Acidobacteriota bacterium]
MQKKNADREIRTTVLPNGLRIVSESMSHVRSVSVGIWVGSGSRREAGAENGVSHFIEHMVFKGTPKRSAEDIARAIDGLGAHLDAFTGKELVCFNTKVLDEHLPAAFDVLSDMVLRPSFREEDIAKEKGVILEELKMEADNPEYLVHETFSANFWKGHPLGKPILGTRETIRGFSRAMIRRYYRSVYTPSNLLVTAAGNVSHERMVDLAAKEFAALKAAPVPAAPEPPASHARVVLRDKRALEQVHLVMGAPAYPVAHDRRFAAYVLNVLLGGSMSSRLFQTIREQRGLVYAVFSEINNYKDSGAFTIYAGTSLATVRQVIGLILEELHNLKETLVPHEELVRGKNHLKGSIMLGLESTTSRMQNLARQQLYFGRFTSLDEVLASIEKVTAEDVRTAARELFQSGGLALTALGNLKGLKLRRQDLAC